MLRGFSASLAAVFTCSQHVRAFTLPHLNCCSVLIYILTLWIRLHTLWNIFWNICTRSSLLFGHAGLLRYSSSNTSSHVRLLLAMLFLHGSLGPNPWLFYFLHVHLARVSSTTSNDFNANFSLRITVADPSMESAQFWRRRLQERTSLSGEKKTPSSGTHTGFSSPSPTHKRDVQYSVDVLVCGTSTVLVTSGYHAVTYNI